MFPYIFIILVLFIGAFVEITIANKRNIKILFIIESLLITLFVGLRFHTGADWAAYEYAFYNMPSLGNYPHWEYGYYILNLICNKLLGNYYVFQFLASCFVVYSASRFFWKHTEYPLSCLLLFFLMFIPNGLLMAQVRQSIAVAIILLGYKYIIDKSLVKFILFVVIASLFHISAIITLPMYFMTKKIPNYIFIISILLFQIFYFVPETIAYILNFLLKFMPDRLEKIGNTYINHVFYANKAQFNTGIYYIASILLAIITMCLVKNNTPTRSFILNSLIIAIIIGTLSTSMNILDRFKPYYLIFGIAAYPLIFNVKISKIKQYASSMIMMILLFTFFYIPLHQKLTSEKFDFRINLPANHSWNPYYNAIIHPKEAEFRTDKK